MLCNYCKTNLKSKTTKGLHQTHLIGLPQVKRKNSREHFLSLHHSNNTFLSHKSFIVNRPRETYRRSSPSTSRSEPGTSRGGQGRRTGVSCSSCTVFGRSFWVGAGTRSNRADESVLGPEVSPASVRKVPVPLYVQKFYLHFLNFFFFRTLNLSTTQELRNTLYQGVHLTVSTFPGISNRVGDGRRISVPVTGRMLVSLSWLTP